MNIIYLAAGAALLILGRKMFWLFVGVVGFLFGLTIAPQVLPGQSQTVILTVSLVIGFLGALLAVAVQKLAVGLAGLLAGAYLANYLIHLFSFNLGSFVWLVIGIGGILGAILAGSMFDWALILLTSASGAVIISDNLHFPQPLSLVALIALFVVGVIIQGNLKGDS